MKLRFWETEQTIRSNVQYAINIESHVDSFLTRKIRNMTYDDVMSRHDNPVYIELKRLTRGLKE